MNAVAIKGFKHGTRTYDVGAVLCAPEFTQDNIDRLVGLKFARRTDAKQPTLIYVARKPIKLDSENSIELGDEIPDGTFTPDELNRMIRLEVAAAVPADMAVVNGKGKAYRTLREVTHKDETYPAETILPDDDTFTAKQLDNLVRIQYAEVIPKPEAPKKADTKAPVKVKTKGKAKSKWKK